MNSWPGYEVIVYAQATGMFAQRGLDVTLTYFEEQSDNLRATMRGHQDASFAGLSQVIQTDIPEAKPQFILIADISAGSDGILARAGIESVPDLADKKVSARFGTLAHLILLEALQANNLTYEDVDIVDIANEKGANHLQQGKIDAAVLWNPLLTETAQKIDGKIIYTTAEVDSIIVDGLVSTSERLAKKQEEFVRFIQVWLEVMDIVHQHPQEVFEVVGRELGQSPTVFAAGFEGMHHGDRALNQKMLVDDGLYGIVYQIQKLLLDDVRHGLIVRNDVVINSQLFSEAVSRP
jgi:NitT/TauT family transport system substrate-binding protein